MQRTILVGAQLWTLVAECLHEKLYIWNKKCNLPHVAQGGWTPMTLYHVNFGVSLVAWWPRCLLVHNTILYSSRTSSLQNPESASGRLSSWQPVSRSPWVGGWLLASTVQTAQTVQTVQSALYTHGTVLLSVHGWSQQVPVLGSDPPLLLIILLAHRTVGIIHKWTTLVNSKFYAILDK